MEIKGEIIKIEETQVISDKFKKRGFVIMTNSKYPNPVYLETQQERVDELDKFNVGDKVECKLDLRGREWTSPQGEVKYFNTIVCWALMKFDGETEEPQKETSNDLPF